MSGAMQYATTARIAVEYAGPDDNIARFLTV
ncbi:hypothetical protein F442_05835 [Phytophthora nicotianae P10297]|uniref:Uncharacterized protein n=4 Tax=Phytophthora nicotianae TaxID=4792 RepID=V9FGZ0_PHYNI|nr:hypothetical protein F443_05788 [Phytophthora nicotianae P1569]ETL97208.1 hypothetical protein L917_05478 [Phytophthora nicotianae]ETO79455.1 hypothetical protein F444_05838 [Phytophthora nicotianae P1976]ETP48405.1 hypothetical protein F442_05835 [Phytophthora nicotianae P10297]